MSFYKTIKTVWKCVPARIRVFFFENNALKRCRISMREFLMRFARHEEIYDSE